MMQGRGGQGVICIQTSERNGRVVGALQVSPSDELMLISGAGTLVRTPVADVSGKAKTARRRLNSARRRASL